MALRSQKTGLEDTRGDTSAHVPRGVVQVRALPLRALRSGPDGADDARTSSQAGVWIVVAVAVVLVVVLVTASMRGQQRRGAARRGEVRHDLDEAEERVERAEHERDVALEGRDSRPEDR
jgi:hypothetical protein